MYAFKDGCFIISNSGIQLITACPTKGYFGIVRRRRKAGEVAPLRLGKHVHTVLAYANRMEGRKKEWTEETQVKALEKLFAQSPCESEEWRNLGMAQNIISAYNERFKEERLPILVGPDGKPLVEKTFAIDTEVTLYGWRVIYTGTIDVVFKYSEGIFVFDYKTTTMLGEMFWKGHEVAEAPRGYCWALKKSMGIDPVGYVIRALAIRKPTKTGVPIDFETQRFFTKEPPGQLDDWFENMISQCDTFLWHHKNNRYPQYHGSCITRYNKPCDFFEVCSLPKRSRDSILESGMFETDDGMSLK